MTAFLMFWLESSTKILWRYVQSEDFVEENTVIRPENILYPNINQLYVSSASYTQ